MKDSLQSGLTFEFSFRIPEEKTVPYLYPESPEFQVMPKVLATGFMVGLFEWALRVGLHPGGKPSPRLAARADRRN
jgi:fluoroacetyl-CoA thioesterase